MSQETFDLLQSLSANMQANGSCLPKEPFMKLEAGTAPILNYQMEQKSGFTAYGHFVPPLSSEVFLPQTIKAPLNNFFEQVKNTEIEIIEKRLREELLMGQRTTKLLPKSVAHVGKNNVKMVHSEGGMNGEQKALPTGTGGSTGDPVVCDFPFNDLVDEVNDGKMPYFYEGLGGYTAHADLLEEPANPNPTLFIIEEYTVASYLGDYGAGKTLKTMSLLPGEKTSITIKTFRESTISQGRAENVLESFNEESVQSIEEEIENESSMNDSNEAAVSHSAGVQASASGKFAVVNASVSGDYNFSANNSSNRTSNIRSLGRALDKHVQTTNNHREVDVNTTTESTLTESEERTIIRELENYNKSRVLNFVFRQLLQEYVTITYLSNIRIGYTNGYPETMRVVDIEELDTLLDSVVKPEQKDAARASLLKYYCKVKNYNSAYVDFIEQKTVDYGGCFPDYTGTENFWGKITGNLDSYNLGNGLEINVPGVILDVNKHILRTDSVVADALLGQGEALDCFNLRTQDAAAMEAHLKNAELLQKMDIVGTQDTAVNKADAYKKVFGDCCETIQTQVIS